MKKLCNKTQQIFRELANAAEKFSSSFMDERRPSQSLALTDTTDDDGWTALQSAARRGHDRVVELLIAQNPQSASAVGSGGWTALHLAAVGGHDRIVELLLTRCPESIDAVIYDGRNALHLAARGGHERVVNLLLAAIASTKQRVGKKRDILAVDHLGLTALHLAAAKGHERIAEKLLALRPELVRVEDNTGNTLLHEASKRCGKQFVAKVFEMNTAAVRALNCSLQTPFGIAVTHDNEEAMDVLQWKLSFDEIMAAFIASKRSYADKITSLRDVVDRPLSVCLHRDVVGTVWQYI